MGELNWIVFCTQPKLCIFNARTSLSACSWRKPTESGFYYVTSAKIERHFYLHQMAAKTQKQAADFTDLSECVCGGNPISTSDKTEKNYPAKA